MFTTPMLSEAHVRYKNKLYDVQCTLFIFAFSRISFVEQFSNVNCQDIWIHFFLRTVPYVTPCSIISHLSV